MNGNHACKQALMLLIGITIIAISSTGLVGADSARRPAFRTHAMVRPVPLTDVEWTAGFWKQKLETVRKVTIPAQWRYFNTDADAPGGHHWINFRIAAGLEQGKWKGTSWHDGDFYKWLEAVAYLYAHSHDPQLDQRMDEVIDVIGRAQQPDGYLSTRIILERRERFQDIHHHELYNMGHLMTAAAAHYRATGKDSFLRIARKTGDYLYATFKDRRPELANFGFNPSNIMGCLDLYRVTGDRKYLKLANIFINMRGSRPAARRHYGLGGTDQTQDRVPLRKEREAVGHAVTAMYLYCGAADAYMETGDKSLLAALSRIANDVAQRKLYIHGGVGPLTHGLSRYRDEVHEAFSHPYFLPNRQSYCETCANIGYAMWNWRMLQITGDSQYADLMERVLYNAGLSGLSVKGDTFLYTNVLRRFGPDVPLLRSDSRERWTYHRSYCCPPQLARTIARLGRWAYGVSADGLWVHLYGENLVDTRLADGRRVRMRQQTRYPWDGKVKLRVEQIEGPREFVLYLRIPKWARGTTIRINGAATDSGLIPGKYCLLRRTWKKGDVVEVDLPMRPQLIQANPLVEEARGQVAVQRGPLIYCLESTDLPEGIDITDVRIPRKTEWQARFTPDLLGGIVVLEGTALFGKSGYWKDKVFDAPELYLPLEEGEPRPFHLRLIPYYAWLNRGPSRMTVWTPLSDWRDSERSSQ